MLKRSAPILMPAALAALVALIVVPLALDQPFGTQTPRTLAWVHAMRRWSPVITPAATALVVALGVGLWRRTRRVAVKAALVAAVAASLGVVWLARQNPFEWMFNPLPQPQFVTRASGTIAQVLDSGERGCIWHRLVLEGSIAPGHDPADIIMLMSFLWRVANNDDGAAQGRRLIAAVFQGLQAPPQSA